jgi:MFS family permease
LVASYSHIFGRKPLTLASLLSFLIGTIVCSVAPNISAFLAGRVIQGLGSGGAIAMVDILISDLVPLRQRATYFGLVSLAWAFGSAAGPLMGSSFAQQVTWRWIFWILLPFNCLALVIVLFCLRLHRKERILTEKLKEVDYIGSLLFVTSSTAFLIGISWGGTQFPWNSFHTLVPLILGIVGLFAFFVWEIYFAPHPLIPIQIFMSRTAAQGYLGITTTGMMLWAALYYLPLYYEGVLGYSFIIGSVSLLPATLTLSPVAVVTGILITKTGRYRGFLWVGWAVMLLGTGLMIDLKEDTTIVQWIFFTIWAGVGAGILFSSMQIAVQAAARDEDVAFAAAMVPELRTFGQTLGLAIFGAVFSNTVKNEITGSSVISSEVAALLADDVIGIVQIVKSIADGPEKQAVVRALWLGTRAVWIACLPILAVSAIASIAARELDLDRVLNSEHKIEKDNGEKDIALT